MSDNAMVAVLLPRRRSKLASGAKDMEHAMSQTQTPRSRLSTSVLDIGARFYAFPVSRGRPISNG
jgi:hypothetical protein